MKGRFELEYKRLPTRDHQNEEGDFENIEIFKDGRSEVLDYEEGIAACGYGRFHWRLLAVCGFANASDAVEIICIAFLLPSAQCDLRLTSGDKGWLSALLFLGMLLGGYLWGGSGDALGRKKALIIAMAVNAVFGFLSSLAQGKYYFMAFRFLSGIGVGGSIPIVWSYFSEFQPKDRRGAMLSGLATFWMIGNIMVAAMAWVIIPRDIGFKLGNFEYNSWRIFVLACGLPALIVAICLPFFPESPKYLLSKGRNDEAFRVMSKIYRTNTSKPASDYPIGLKCNPKNFASSIEDYGVVEDFDSEPGSFANAVSTFFKNLSELFQKRYGVITVTMIFINFSIQFGYYGLWLWFPELFSKLDNYYKDHPNDTVNVCEITNYVPKPTDGDSVDPFCANSEVSTKVFIESFIVSISALPGNLCTILFVDRIGRKIFVVTSMALSGLSAFLIYLVTSSTWNLAVSCVFGAVATMGFNGLTCLGVELFPTHLRGTAMATTLAFARVGAILGNIVFGYLVETNCAIPILSVATLLVLGGLASLILPETARVSIA